VRCLAVLPAALLAGVLHAHSLSHTAQSGSAVIVELRYADGSPFSYESAEVFRPAESIPFLAARTDANGRLAFVPDRPGDWRVRAFSEDGHGGDFTVSAGGDGTASAGPAPLGALERGAIGVALLFGIFGIWSLFLRRRS
jgi:nickel transport protein